MLELGAMQVLQRTTTPSSSGTLPFWKATACGNDFLICAANGFSAIERTELTIRMCDRTMGMGADGVEWLSSTPEADVAADLINSDGSQAEISGNGTRCVASFWHAQHGGSSMRIRTGAGVKTCRFIGFSGFSYQFEMEMGEPVVLPALQVRAGNQVLQGQQVSMGNPHFTTFVQEFPRGWQALGKEVQEQAVFPHGTNVEFVRVLSKNAIETRFFERGAGETQSSGTGSCAAAVAAIHTGKCNSPVEVKAPGGSQSVRWEGKVFLTGPAILLGKGEFF